MKKLYTLLLLIFVAFSAKSQIVISQVYGGGGNSGAPYTHDFVELFNRGTVSVDISSWSVQYASTAGTTWSVTAIPAATSIAPGKYYLIKLAGGATGVALPTPDLDITASPANLSGTNGKVALVNNTTALSGATLTAGTYVDLVGYGTASAYEGSAAVAALSNTTSGIRLNGGCTDNNSNNTDFSTGAPSPRNSSTAANVCSTNPSLAISSPTNGAIFSPTTTNVNVALSVSNFNVASGTGDGHIHYTVNGGGVVMKYDTTPIALSSLTPGTYIVYVELVDNAHNPISPAVNATVTFTIASYNVVADIAALRADVIANGTGRYYQITSNPVITFKRATRNQKYIQDASAAVVIDDAAGIITTTMNAGDAIASLKGQSLLFNGLLELVPTEDASVASTGNTVTPQVVTISDVVSNIENYESELVRINGITFDATATNFAVNTNTPITAPTASVFRTVFTATEVDYIGQPIPTASTSIIAFPGENTVAVTSPSIYFVARSLAEINLSSASFDNIDGLTMYPNPLSGNTLFLTSTANADMSVQIFDILGKEVVKANVINNSVNVAKLTAGVYVVKITEEGKTATRKLVIK
ncbi:MAG TPA: T9SS type A sorting domain-containing protein [Flavobacterium sp.]|uniref:T9SS type A sorting domain-containing protein n=1 Tax=Flavobacterium sp. TaxID=239 RepID=UPI002B4B8055|nr:T9SS type A sorting domain-containing protein [Flavobacterium sp.]HLO74142.1 T9SS type A sorting domain-containing protein [Flavobacterium sp.]